MERWRAVTGYDNYEVSDHGRVRSKVHGTWKLRRLTRAGDYWYLPLRKNGVPKNFYIHRLVAVAFVKGKGPIVRHRDDNPDHNHYLNLAWGTQADNIADKVRKGRQQKGSEVPQSKLTETTALEALILCREGHSDLEVSDLYSVSRAAITYLRLRKTWKHVPFTEAPD